MGLLYGIAVLSSNVLGGILFKFANRSSNDANRYDTSNNGQAECHGTIDQTQRTARGGCE